MALTKLWPVMLPHLDLPRALLRGRFMKAAACMEHAGVPVDIHRLRLLRAKWLDIQDALIAEVDQQYHVFDGRSFREDRWEQWLTRRGIP
jgi:DNA polymerase-1